MAYEDNILELMEKLVIADKKIIADLMPQWKQGTSSVNNAYKALTNLVNMGKLEKGDTFFRIPGCRSLYKEHSRLLSLALSDILKLNLPCKIYREKSIEEIGLKPDAIVLLTKDSRGLCFILEVCNNETEEYLTQKINAWTHWEGGLNYLSKLFGTEIPCFDILASEKVIEGASELQDFLKEVANA